MAAMSSIVRVFSKNVRHFVLRTPPVILRSKLFASTVGNGESDKLGTPTAEDNSTYKVQEYFSYNKYSFYDLENVIDSSGRRQIQPDPVVKYQHTDPWAKKAETSAS
ncbi:uncharacterized protein [Montipora foliosa]|uniref:uncharacterized protein isoform X1 n=1 Tax=Montipora foliosa TaxID=591990 RepID=UPI0035F1388A